MESHSSAWVFQKAPDSVLIMSILKDQIKCDRPWLAQSHQKLSRVSPGYYLDGKPPRKFKVTMQSEAVGKPPWKLYRVAIHKLHLDGTFHQQCVMWKICESCCLSVDSTDISGPIFWYSMMNHWHVYMVVQKFLWGISEVNTERVVIIVLSLMNGSSSFTFLLL